MTSEFERGMLRAAELAELYADENIRMTHDTILLDPILSARGRKEILNGAQLAEAEKVSEQLTMDAHGHSNRYHAGKDIAAMIRREAGNTVASKSASRAIQKR